MKIRVGVWSAVLLMGMLAISGCDRPVPDGSPSSETSGSSAQVNRSQPNPGPEQLAELKNRFAQTPFEVLHIAEQTWDKGPALAVTFSAPVDPTANWHNYLTVTREDAQGNLGEGILGEQLNRVYFPFIEPQARYRVTVRPGLKAINGRTLTEETSRTVTTRARQEQVRFVTSGSQLAPSLSEGLTVEAVNVPAVDVDFFRVKDEGIGEFLQRGISGYAYDLRSLKNYASLAYSARFDLRHPKDKTLRSVLPVTEIDALNQPGIYIAIMKPAGDYPYEYSTTWFTMGELGVQVRKYPGELVALAHNALSVTAANGVEVSLHNRDGELLRSGTTSSDGLVRFATSMDDAVYMVAAKGDSYAVLSLTGPAMDLSEFARITRASHPLEFFLYGPRDIYRPGEDVVLAALLRDQDGRLSGAQPVKARIYKPDGRLHHSFSWQGDDQAFYQHQFALPDNAMRGEWWLAAELGNGDEFTYTFKVEDFLPERMKLQLDSPAAAPVTGNQPLPLTIQGDYLWGAPASGNRAEVTLDLQPVRELFDEQWPGFIFGAEGYNDYTLTEPLDEVTLDQSGTAQVSVPPRWQGTKQPLRIAARVSLFESGGRPVTRTLTRTYWPRASQLGVRPMWDGAVASPRSQVSVELVNLSPEGEPVAKEAVSLTLIREDQRYYWEWDDGWRYQNADRNVPVYTRVMDLPAARQTLELPVEYGHYRLEAKGADGALLASYRFYAGWRWDRPQPGATGRPDKLELALEADALVPGQDASISFDAPWAGLAVLTLEGGELLWHGSQSVDEGQNTLTFPVSGDWHRHDIHASVTLLRGGDAERKHLPKRAFGLLHVPLKRSARQLDVTLEAPEKALPDSKLEVAVNIAAPVDEPVYVTLAAVDTGVLSVTGFETPSAFDWFFAPRRYPVAIRDTWAAFIEQLSGRLAIQRYGGDAEALSRGGDAPQTDVQIVSLWSGKVAVDQNGRATIPLDLPYFNGELRLMAQAWSHNRFGDAEQTVTVAAPLVAEVNLPRFLAKGDSTQATLDLQNLTDRKLTLATRFSASAELGSTVQTRQLTIAPGGRELLQLPLEGAVHKGTGEVAFTANEVTGEDGALELNRQWSLGLRPAYPARTTRHTAVVQPGATAVLPGGLAQGLDSAARNLLVSVSSQPPIQLSEHLDHLIQYPYGCLEQTTSRAWPLVMTGLAELERLDSSPDKTISRNRDQLVAGAIARIQGKQLSNGAFALWGTQGPENPWLTVYATDFLLSAKAAGHNVDDTVLTDALEKLRSYLTLSGKLWVENQIYSQSPDHYHLSFRAYAALVLVQRQQASLGELRVLYDNYVGSARSALPLAQLALALELAGDGQRARQAWQKVEAFERPDSRVYYGDYGTAIRDRAWVTTLALQSRLASQPESGLFALAEELRQRRWLSTQERFALYRLGRALADHKGRWQARLLVDGDATRLTPEGRWQRRWNDEQLPGTVAVENLHDKPLYLSALAQGYPAAAPDPVSEGIQVRRRYYSMDGRPVNPTRLNSGDLLLVRLDVQSTDNERLADALVVELLPAGLELENQNLESAVSMADAVVGGRKVSEWLQDSRIQHREYRDDRYVAAVDIPARSELTLFYLARAVTPGRYQVPPTLVEDMYRPEIRALGDSPSAMVIEP